MGFFQSSGILNRRGFFGGAPAFKPSDIAGLQLWLDATTGLFDATSGGNAVTTDGSAVARWEDQSGNGRHATQTTLNNRPILKTSIQNGLNGIQFDGSNDSMATDSFTHPVPLTIFVVMKSNKALQTIYGRIVEHGANNGMVIIYGEDGSRTISYQYASSTFTGSGVSPSTNKFILEYFVSSSATRNLTFRVNNGNQTTSTRTGTPATPTSFYLSNFGGGGSYNGSQDIYEICYYNTELVSENRTKVRDYLNTRWAIY